MALPLSFLFQAAAPAAAPGGAGTGVFFLQMGMIVEVEGGTVTAATVSGGLATSTAEVIRITNQLQGPVDDFSSSSLGMLGQHIDVNAATVLEGVSSLAEANSSNCANGVCNLASTT